MTVRVPVCAACLLLAQPAIPPLPRLALDSYPSPAREAISRAYRDAIERPTDAAAVGTLARPLHAWEQWSAAHEAYTRAQALSPVAFEWQYLDALVLRRLARHGEAVPRLEQALKASPDYLPARVTRAEALFESGDLERSARLFEPLRRGPAAGPAPAIRLRRLPPPDGAPDVALRQPAAPLP